MIESMGETNGLSDRPVSSTRGIPAQSAKSVNSWRSPVNMQVVKAENGWVVHCGSLCWIAPDSTKLVKLMEELAIEFEQKEVQI